MGALVLLIWPLRGENVALLAYIPLMLLVTRQARPQAVLKLAVWLVLASLLFRGVRARLDGPQMGEEAHRRYGLYLLYGPVGFMVTNNYSTPTPQEDRRVISDVIDYDGLIARYSPFAFLDYVNSTRPYVSKESYRAFQRLYVRSAIDNPGLYLANRVMVLMRCIEAHPHTWYNFMAHRESLTEAQICWPPYTGLFARHGMDFERENPSALSRLTHRLRDLSVPAGFASPGYYLWNAIPALGLTVLGVLGFRRFPVTASVCGVVAAPLVLFTAAVPATHFTYIFDLYVFGFLVIPIMMLESGPLRRLRTRAAGPPDGGDHDRPGSLQHP
jgi:hypothetical protein